MKLWMNGAIIEQQQAVVSVYDHGFLYGMGLFETFRTYGGKPFLLKRHLERLAEGCRVLGISYMPDEDEIRTIVQELLHINSLTDAYFRFTVSAGEDILGLPSNTYEQPHALMYIKPLPSAAPDAILAGKALQLLSLPRNTPEGTVRLKSLHYMNNILAKRELATYPSNALGPEGLFLTRDGHLAEGIVSNLFFVQGNKLLTPSIDTGILQGITRSFVLELAVKSGWTVKEGLFVLDELWDADEVFLTNSIQEIVPVNALFDTTGKSRTVPVGEATLSLLRQYRSVVFS